MSVKILQSAEELNAYDAWVKAHPQGNLWQSIEWKQYQESMGREVRIYADVRSQISDISSTALVVIDRTIGGLSTWDIAKGPLTSTNQAASVLMDHIIADARKERCMSLYCSPDSDYHMHDAHCSVRNSERCEQSPATRIIDLTASEEGILAQMHQKGRYNIKVAQKHGVTITKGTKDDIDDFYTLLLSTSKRDIFSISPKSHYVRFLTDLPDSYFLIAKHENKPVAALLGVMWHGTGFYYYGASDHHRRNLMSPYLLQWESMKLCKDADCKRYDLLGIAPIGSDATHHWAGISSFKEKFGGTVISYPPEQEITLRPMVKWLLGMKRKIVG